MPTRAFPIGHATASMMAARTLCCVAAASLLTACGSIQYTVDDGRRVNEALLANIRTLGSGEQAIRPALARAAALKSTACETQWELPFAVASSDGLEKDDRIAWVRALKVDERLTVIASTPESALALGDRIAEIDSYRSDDGEKMYKFLLLRRDDGKPFQIATAEGRRVRVTPLQVCRGHVTIAAPSSPAAQDYHWLSSTHPLEVFRQNLTRDEALWVVLWTQGLSEEGGARMKAYQYGFVPLRFLANIAAVASGVGAAAKAAQSAGAAVGSAAGLQIAKNIATSQVVGLAQQQAAIVMAASSKNRASLEGVAWAAGTAFEKADTWSFERMRELGADPLAAVTLHQKLVNAGSAANAFALDAERITLLQSTAKSARLDTRMASILSGHEPGTDVRVPEPIIPQLTTNAIHRLEVESVALPSDSPANAALIDARTANTPGSRETEPIVPQLTTNAIPKLEVESVALPTDSFDKQEIKR